MINNDKANESLSKTEDKAGGLASKLQHGIGVAAKWAVGLGVAAAAVGGAMFGLANKAADATDRIDKLSQKIGLSREAFQEYDYILSQSGTDIEKLQVGMKTLRERMDEAAEGTGEGAKAFQALKLEAIDPLTGSLKSQDQMLEETIKALQQMPESAEKSKLAFDLFGKAGTELMPLLNDTSASMDALRSKAHDLGLVMSDDAVDSGVLFQDTMDDLKKSLGTVMTKIGVEFMPIFQGLADWIILHMPEIQEVMGKVFDFIMNGVAVLRAFWEENGEAISSFVSATFEIIKEVVTIAMGIIKGVIEVVMGIISGDWERVWGGLEGILTGIFELIGKALGLALDALIAIITGIGKAAKDAGKAMFQAVWDGMKEIWTKLSTWVSEKVTWLIDKLAFWRKSESEMASGTDKKPKQSNASGLAFVPYDGYETTLHYGERVMTKQDNEGLAAQIVNGLSAVMGSSNKTGEPIQLVVNLNGKTIAREIYPDIKNEGKRLGEVGV